MKRDHEIDVSSRKITTQLIINRAIERKWGVVGFDTNSALLLLTPYKSDKHIPVFSASPPNMSYVSTKIARDKFITNQLLSQLGLPVPKEHVISSDKDVRQAYDFLKKYKRVVIKPLNASHGNGVTTDIIHDRDIDEAVEYAIDSCSNSNSTILVQEQTPGIDVRIVCIDYKFVDAIVRLPACVVGDGKHSIYQLIDNINSDGERSDGYTTRLNKISIAEATRYLGKKTLNTTPENGERVQVVGASNIGKGGVRLNVKESIPNWLKQMAESASKEIDLPMSGVDFMISRMPKKSDTEADLNPKLIEINSCPSLAMYDDLQSEDQNNIIDIYLDYVASVYQR